MKVWQSKSNAKIRSKSNFDINDAEIWREREKFNVGMAKVWKFCEFA